jgi:hypothetical protein
MLQTTRSLFRPGRPGLSRGRRGQGQLQCRWNAVADGRVCSRAPRPPTGLAKCNSEQARTQQHKTGRGQREESVGNEVMITHCAPTARDAGPNLLKISESAFFAKGQKVLRADAEIRPSNESHHRHGQEKRWR